MRITYFGHASFLVQTQNKRIYIDPYAGPETNYNNADIILVSQWHFDHCNMAKLRRAMRGNTHILGTREVAAQVYPSGFVMPKESRRFDDVEVVAMPVVAKNVNYRGHEGDEERERLGFVIISEGKKVYFMGDSIYMPQLSKMKPDILLIAVGGTFTQTPEEAAKDADVIEPNYAVPMCWGGPEGTRDNAQLFKDLAKVPVKVLSAGESLDF